MQEAKRGILASHRSGETEDSFLADITAGLACGQLKSGAPARWVPSSLFFDPE